MLTSHPTDARYYSSRSQARIAAGHGDKVTRLGQFAAGSFGCYPRLKSNGLAVGQVPGGPMPRITVWMVSSH